MKEILSYMCLQKHRLLRDDTNTSVLCVEYVPSHSKSYRRRESQVISGKTPIGLGKFCALTFVLSPTDIYQYYVKVLTR